MLVIDFGVRGHLADASYSRFLRQRIPRGRFIRRTLLRNSAQVEALFEELEDAGARTLTFADFSALVQKLFPWQAPARS